MVGMSHLDEDVGAGAMEAVGPGIERGDKGAAFQGAAPWAGKLLTFPASPGALAVCGEGEPEWWAGLLGPDGTPGCSGLASWPSPGLRLLCSHVPMSLVSPSCLCLHRLPHTHQVRQASAVTSPGA